MISGSCGGVTVSAGFAQKGARLLTDVIRKARPHETALKMPTSPLSPFLLLPTSEQHLSRFLTTFHVINPENTNMGSKKAEGHQQTPDGMIPLPRRV
jgi:hypothetical protein